jgi:hypothetical protein
MKMLLGVLTVGLLVVFSGTPAFAGGGLVSDRGSESQARQALDALQAQLADQGLDSAYDGAESAQQDFDVQNATECAPYVGSCEYYRCREAIQPCGEKGYFMRFGYRYCTTFLTKLKPRVAPRQQDWLERVGTCLQQKVEEIPVITSCTLAKNLAIDSHVDCYMKTGFCAMPFSLKLKLLGIVYPELEHSRMRTVFLDILARCELPGSSPQSF